MLGQQSSVMMQPPLAQFFSIILVHVGDMLFLEPRYCIICKVIMHACPWMAEIMRSHLGSLDLAEDEEVDEKTQPTPLSS